MDPNEYKLNEEEALLLANELKAQLNSGKLESTDEKRIKLMVAGLGDKRGLLRRTFAEGLGAIGKTTVPLLCEALKNNSNVTIRRAAAKSLKLVGDPIALPNLIEALTNDPDPVVQGSAVGAMAIFGEKSIEPLIQVLINPKSTSLQCGLATWGLAFVGDKAPKALLKAAKSQYPAVRAAAISALGDQIQSNYDKDAIHLLKTSLNDEANEVRVAATTLLGNINKQKWSFDLLVLKLSDKSLEVRKSAVISLMRIGDIKALAFLIKKKEEETDPNLINIIRLAINCLKS